ADPVVAGDDVVADGIAEPVDAYPRVPVARIIGLERVRTDKVALDGVPTAKKPDPTAVKGADRQPTHGTIVGPDYQAVRRRQPTISESTEGDQGGAFVTRLCGAVNHHGAGDIGQGRVHYMNVPRALADPEFDDTLALIVVGIQDGLAERAAAAVAGIRNDAGQQTAVFQKLQVQ